MKSHAERYNEKAHKLEGQGKAAEAIAQYRRAISADPRWSVPWFNLGLLYKRQRRWADCLACNKKAAVLDARDKATWWNLGIAATALEDWQEARRAWTAFGIELPAGDGPLEMQLGLTPVRLNPTGAAEVVWGRRIDPARLIIESIPFPASEHRYGDLILHDGAPNGFRKVNGRDVPVFDELQLLTPSDLGTFEVIIDGADEAAIAALLELADEQKLAAEDWTANTRMICKACSEGRPDDHEHTHAPAPADDRRLAFAATSAAQIEQVLTAWRAQTPQAEVIEINCLLAPAAIN